MGDDDAFQTFKQAFQAANERSSDVVYTMLEAMTRKGVYCQEYKIIEKDNLWLSFFDEFYLIYDITEIS